MKNDKDIRLMTEAYDAISESSSNDLQIIENQLNELSNTVRAILIRIQNDESVTKTAFKSKLRTIALKIDNLRDILIK